MFSATSEWLIFFLDFCLIRKYTKYYLNLTFGWECNNTPSLTSSLLHMRVFEKKKFLNRPATGAFTWNQNFYVEEVKKWPLAI